jgi:hypothetical protein
MCGIMCTVFFFGLRAENKKRDAGGRDYRFERERDELENMGDDHPDFRYTTGEREGGFRALGHCDMGRLLRGIVRRSSVVNVSQNFSCYDRNLPI